jgi:cytochrome c oxidase cbb3-type subunit I/II
MSFGTLYWLVPRLWKRELAYPKMATQHFWLATIGIVLYTVSMWVAGLMEGLQWRAVNDAGQLANPIFLDIVNRLMPYYWMRLLGGTLYLAGMLMFIFNLMKTIWASGEPASEQEPEPAPAV